MRICYVIIAAIALIFIACTPQVSPATTPAVVRILTEDYPPYNFTDKNGNVAGQSTEIVQSIMEKIGALSSIEIVPLSQGLSETQGGPLTAIYSINRTEQRENLYKWVGSLGFYEQAFYTLKNSTITLNQFEDAIQLDRIAVYHGDAGAQFLSSHGFKNLDESNTDAEALQKLVSGQAQLWLGNTSGLDITAEMAGVDSGNLVKLPAIVIHADLYIAFSKDVPDSTIAAWQNALDALKIDRDIDGKTVIDKIRAKYADPLYLENLLH